jgi:periplasmic protein TonB
MTSEPIPGLDELAFEGRNKAYGAYYIRKRYPRYLLISFLSGITVISLAVFLSWCYYYFEPIPLTEGDLMYEVEYYDMSIPPNDEPNKLAQSFAKPVQEFPKVPVVTDSINPEKQKPEEIPPEEKPDDVRLKTDSAAKSGGSGLGNGVGDDAGISTSPDVNPRYPGGDEARLYYIRRSVKYPEVAMKALIQGVVIVVFIVETDGSISNVNVTKRIGGGCDEEAMRVAREMPRWEPGKRNGKPVRVIIRMPIEFRIPGKGTVRK